MAFKHEPQNHKGATDVWLTPKEFIEKLGPFDLDPCAAPEPRPWETAKKNYVKKDDGLSQRWDGFVWLNPPYGKETGKWMKKLSDHQNGIALVFARTETKWFQEVVEHASIVFFPAGRITFYESSGKKSKSNGGAPSVFLGFGNLARIKLSKCDIKGHYFVNQ